MKGSAHDSITSDFTSELRSKNDEMRNPLVYTLRISQNCPEK